MVEISEIIKLANLIVQFYNPEKIILFGSYAYGIPNDTSDIDIMVIMPYDGKSSRKSLEIWKKIKPNFSIDLLVKTPADFIRRYNFGDPLIGDAMDKGKILYERNS